MKRNYAFIDGQNVNLGIKELGWSLDFRRFRVYLDEKYDIGKAFYFIGYLPGQERLYNALRSYGYTLIFKPTFKNKEGKIKGNCDAELVLQAVIELDNYRKAVIVSGDGDFFCLVNYLRKKNKLETVLAPNMYKYSGLLKQSARNKLAFMNELSTKLGHK